MSENTNIWSRIESSYGEDNFCRINAWKTDEGEERMITAAAVDMVTGRVLKMNPEACRNPAVQKQIDSIVEGAKQIHPYSVERLESILCSVVDYECGEGLDDGREDLISMGFDEEEMLFFGFPPSIE